MSVLRKILLASLGVGLSGAALAFDCTIKFVKDSCWGGYSVTLQAIDAKTLQPMDLKVSLAKDQFAVRQHYRCKPGQSFTFRAQFEPTIWANQKGKIYHARPAWTVPQRLAQGEVSWDVPVCFMKNFASVPLPPTSTGHCKCDFSPLDKK